jgi:hypothetical protein
LLLLLLLLLVVGMGAEVLLPGVSGKHLAQMPFFVHLLFILILSGALLGALSQSSSSSGQYRCR